ncbi:MAG: GCN5-related N-acetyltransferase [Candidatus Kaiserbacteria bacterium]|nr:GCN5-related N-acetyltransferase [Candidatus Kaiserbacteria bacterium]
MIRKATAADFPAIQSIIARFPDTLIQVHLPEPEEFFVAEEEGTVIACCALEVYSKRLAEVRSLAVLPEHQGKGIATALVARCLEEAKALNVYEVLTITGATSLFEKQGFGAFNKEKFALIQILG